jgi:hypothetical protein
LCGKFLNRGKGVKHLCRYCHCPTNKADDPNARYPYKTQKQIQKMCEKGEVEKLRAISQNCIRNAWYRVTFHHANDRGIHGACPSEMLHAILLGIFKYLRDIFFDNCGKESQLSEDINVLINGLAKMYGSLFIHQSDRDLPNANFSRGIRKGKLMAKEYRGVLLVMAAVLRSTEGRKLLMSKKKFGGEPGLIDWTWLTEMLLEWESYLNEKQMRESDVKRLATKNRFIMYIRKNVAKRYVGMGLKVREPWDMHLPARVANLPNFNSLQPSCLPLDADHEVPCHCSPLPGYPSVWCSLRSRHWFQRIPPQTQQICCQVDTEEGSQLQHADSHPSHRVHGAGFCTGGDPF